MCTFWLATCTWLSFWPAKLLTLGCSLDGTGGTLDLDQHTWKWNCLPPVSHLDIFPHSSGHPWNGSTLYSCQVPKKCEEKQNTTKWRKKNGCLFLWNVFISFSCWDLSGWPNVLQEEQLQKYKWGCC